MSRSSSPLKVDLTLPKPKAIQLTTKTDSRDLQLVKLVKEQHDSTEDDFKLADDFD
jgi:hypothetical protein